MTRLPRVVATDLDGTLLDSRGQVSERTRNVLADLDAAGVEVVFVTARPPRWLTRFTDAVGGHGRVICIGGACVLDLASGETLDTCGFDDDAALAVVTGIRAALPHAALAFERPGGVVFDPTYPNREPALDPGLWSVPVEDTLGADRARGPVSKILALDPAYIPPPGIVVDPPEEIRLAQEQFFAAVRGAIGPHAQLAYSGAVGLAELMPPGVDKAAALARWCARLGVDASDVWAFGDMPNDLPMLTWAGRGIAVANAHSEVLACADAVVGHHDADGVAEELATALLGSAARAAADS
ncbi:HAD family hydrolase [Promicromonospora iranensis]|uniref:HAD family hydrolase n=1 Tax=Promicromonospora iranensis TaxID=1105144 RepID=UPI0023A983F5|nr:HAD family hydrolase [Promicromonospora iranensis]